MSNKKARVTLPDTKQVDAMSKTFDKAIESLTNKPRLKSMPEIDWDYWLLKPRFHDWEAAALLCGIPPEELLCTDNSREFAPFDWCGLEDEFRKKLAVIAENSRFADYGNASGDIELPKLMNWVKANTPWKIPARLEALCHEVIEKPRGRKMTEKDKQVAIKLNGEGKKSAEIAAHLKLPDSTIRQFLSRERKSTPTPSTIFKIKK